MIITEQIVNRFKEEIVVARRVAENSDEEVKVGCILGNIIDSNFISLASGYNYEYSQRSRTPLGNEPRDIIHAEMAAALYACKKDFNVAIIANKFPCYNCAEKLIQRGVKCFVVDSNIDLCTRWTQSQTQALKLINDLNLTIIKVY